MSKIYFCEVCGTPAMVKESLIPADVKVIIDNKQIHSIMYLCPHCAKALIKSEPDKLKDAMIDYTDTVSSVFIDPEEEEQEQVDE